MSTGCTSRSTLPVIYHEKTINQSPDLKILSHQTDGQLASLIQPKYLAGITTSKPSWSAKPPSLRTNFLAM